MKSTLTTPEGFVETPYADQQRAYVPELEIKTDTAPSRPLFDKHAALAWMEYLTNASFDAYGAVVLEREVTGDPQAIPLSAGGFGRGAGGMPSIVDKFVEVDTWLRKQAAEAREIVEYAHKRGVIETHFVFTFEDGTHQRISAREVDVRPPVAWVAVDAITRSQKPDWNAYPKSHRAHHMRVVHQLMGFDSYGELIERAYQQIKRAFARDHGITQLAREYVADSRKPPQDIMEHLTRKKSKKVESSGVSKT